MLVQRKKLNESSDVLKELVRKSLEVRGITTDDLLKKSDNYETHNLLECLKCDSNLSFKNFVKLIDLAGLTFNIYVHNGPNTAHTVTYSHIQKLVSYFKRAEYVNAPNTAEGYVDVTVTMGVRIKKSAYDELKKIEHHVDSFVDCDGWKDIIESIHDVTVE